MHRRKHPRLRGLLRPPANASNPAAVPTIVPNTMNRATQAARSDPGPAVDGLAGWESPPAGGLGWESPPAGGLAGCVSPATGGFPGCGVPATVLIENCLSVSPTCRDMKFASRPRMPPRKLMNRVAADVAHPGLQSLRDNVGPKLMERVTLSAGVVERENGG
jgi:hypothetical protein